MPTFAAKTGPDTTKIRATRQRAMLASRIARDGQNVVINRRSDSQGAAAYTQTVACLVRQVDVLGSDIVIEGIENVGQAEPTMFTFEGGLDIAEATDRIVWQGHNRRIAYIRRHSEQGQITGLYCLTVRE